MRRTDFTPTILYLLAGLIVWGIRFLFVYSFTAVACARGWAQADLLGFDTVAAGIMLATVIGVSACAALIWRAAARLGAGRARAADDNGRFVHALAALTAGMAIIAMLWETAPVLFVPMCVA